MLFFKIVCRMVNAKISESAAAALNDFCQTLNEKTSAECAPDYGFFVVDTDNTRMSLVGLTAMEFALKYDVRREVTRLLADKGYYTIEN